VVWSPGFVDYYAGRSDLNGERGGGRVRGRGGA